MAWICAASCSKYFTYLEGDLSLSGSEGQFIFKNRFFGKRATLAWHNSHCPVDFIKPFADRFQRMVFHCIFIGLFTYFSPCFEDDQ